MSIFDRFRKRGLEETGEGKTKKTISNNKIPIRGSSHAFFNGTIQAVKHLLQYILLIVQKELFLPLSRIDGCNP